MKRARIYPVVRKSYITIADYWHSVRLIQPPTQAQAQWYTTFRIEWERIESYKGVELCETESLEQLAERLFVFGNMLANAEGIIVTRHDNSSIWNWEDVLNACEDLGVMLDEC